MGHPTLKLEPLIYELLRVFFSWFWKSDEVRRSQNILKVKKFLDDEGEVVSHNFNKDGSFRSLNLKLKNGIVFKLGGGFSNKDRENPPKIGEFVTFKYYGFTKNSKPKFASFLRVRKKE